MIKKLFPIFRSGDAFAYQGMRQFVVGDYLNAINNFLKAADRRLKIYDEYEIHTRIGDCYYHLYLYDKAIDAYKKAIALNKDHHQAWLNLGVAHRVIGNFKEALNCYMESVRLKPDFPDAHASLGAVHIYLNEPEKAYESLKKAIELDPSFNISHSNMALTLALLSRYEEAEVAARRAVSLGSKNGKELLRRIEELKNLDDPQFDIRSFIIWRN